MSEGWRMGYMISDTIVMYPFNMMLRQMKKRNIDPAEELRVTIALPDGTEVPGLEIGMNIEMTLAFAVVVIPEGVVVKKTDFSKKFIIHIEDKVFLIAKRAEEWEFCPFYLPSEINGELKFKKEKYFSVERSSQQLTTEALGSLVVRENGELLGLIVRKDGKRYSAVIENLSAFAEAVDIAINRPEELKEYEDLPEPRRRPGAPGRIAPVFGMGG